MEHSGPGIQPGNRRATARRQSRGHDNVETLKRENKELKKEIQRLKDEIRDFVGANPSGVR